MEDFNNKVQVMNEIKKRIIISGRVNSDQMAEEIARRWVYDRN